MRWGEERPIRVHGPWEVFLAIRCFFPLRPFLPSLETFDSKGLDSREGTLSCVWR